MGIAGTIEYLSDLLRKKKKRKKHLNSVSLKIRMCCQGCGHAVKTALSGVKGAKSVKTEWKIQKATVIGYNVEPMEVLEAAKKTKRRSELWPYVPYDMVAHPYAPGVYDKKAPPNCVRENSVPGVGTLSSMEEQYTLMFSDDNPHACTIM